MWTPPRGNLRASVFSRAEMFGDELLMDADAMGAI
jgi:hypothetical protein